MFSRRLASNAIRASGRHGQSFTSSLRTQNQNIPSRLPQPQRLFSPSLLRCLSTEVRGAIDRAVGSAPVVLFMKGTPETPQCGFSRASVQILGLQGVDPTKFVAFNVLEDQALREGIKEYSEWPTIPQLYVKGEFVGGCDILVDMHQSGELAKLFEKSDVLVTEAEATDATVGETSSAETKA